MFVRAPRSASQRLARLVIGLLVGVLAGYGLLAALFALLLAISSPR